MTLRSMTGFGRARRTGPRFAVVAEVRAVNGRFLGVRCRLPADLAHLDPKIDALVKRSIERGNVDVLVRVSVRQRPEPRVDARALAVYRKALDRLGGGDHAALLSLPGVITMGETETSTTAMERLAMAAVRDALGQAVRARQTEGRRLTAALRRETRSASQQLGAIERAMPRVVKRQRDNLRRRLASLLDNGPLAADDPVLRREVAVLADRSDVTEEVDRLKTHMTSFSKTLASKRPVGRQMDFLLQEIGREVNTLGAKCNDAAVAGRVVQLKTAMERLREQAANIE